MKVLLLLLFIYLIFPVRIQNSQLASLPIICLFSWHCFLILPFLPPSLSQCGFLLSRTPGHAQVNIPGAKNVRSGISSNRELSRHLLNAMNTSRLNIRCIYIALMGLVPIDKAELLKKKYSSMSRKEIPNVGYPMSKCTEISCWGSNKWDHHWEA